MNKERELKTATPRDIYFFLKNFSDFSVDTYFTLSSDKFGFPVYLQKENILLMFPPKDPAFDERWENDQILLHAFMRGWDTATASSLIRTFLFADYDIHKTFWEQYNYKMPELIKALRERTTFLK